MITLYETTEFSRTEELKRGRVQILICLVGEVSTAEHDVAVVHLDMSMKESWSAARVLITCMTGLFRRPPVFDALTSDGAARWSSILAAASAAACKLHDRKAEIFNEMLRLNTPPEEA